MKDYFKGRTAVLATKHGKEKVIAPILEKELGISVIVPEGFDSDAFGTFTREISRRGNQLEAARAKAKAAIELTGADLVIASEGSFGPDPQVPFINSNFELILLVDAVSKLEIRGHYRTPETNAAEASVSSVDEAIEVARAWGFPEHGVIARLNPKIQTFLFKDIHTEIELREKVTRILSLPLVTSVYLETDLRAHRNPTRMNAIEKAAEDLALNCLSTCPRCNTPGFVPTEGILGATCNLCSARTDRPKGSMYRCFKCGYHEERLFENVSVDASECQFCNP